MAQNTSHRRNLAAFLDPTLNIHLMQQSKSSSTVSSAARHHASTTPDPTIPITIDTISNHKSLSATDPHLQPRPLSAASSVLDSSCTDLTKSKSQRGKNFQNDSTTNTKKAIVRQQLKRSDEIKKTSKKKEPSNFQQQGHCEELKRASSLSAGMGGGGRRRSFCSSQIELADIFSYNSVKVVSVDMAPFMQIHAVNFARKVYDSLEKFTPNALALTLKKEFDGVYGAAWHCIVGSSFGSFVTHSVGGFIYFSMDHKLHVLLFKTSVKRAN